jgi:hypothetical protein
VTLAARIKAPVLLVHGGKDKRAPLDQAEAMRAALIKAGHPPEWFLAPNEGHGFYDTKNRDRVLPAPRSLPGQAHRPLSTCRSAGAPDHGARIRTPLPAHGQRGGCQGAFRPVKRPGTMLAMKDASSLLQSKHHMDQAIGIDLLRRRRHFRLAAGVLLCAGFLAAAWGINRAVRPGVSAADIVVAEVRRGNVDNTVNAAGVVIPSTRKSCPAPARAASPGCWPSRASR